MPLKGKKLVILAAIVMFAVLLLAGCAGGGAPEGGGGAPEGGGGGGEGGGGAGEGADEALVTYKDPAGAYSFQYPQSWTETRDKNGVVRFQGRDSFVGVAIKTNAGSDVMAFAATDKAQVAKEFAGYTEISLKPSSEVRGAVVLSFEWDAGSSTITGKPVRARADRYYIPESNGRVAVMTGSEPTSVFDRQTVRDVALTVRAN